MFIKVLIVGLLGLSLDLSGCCFRLFRKRPALTQNPLSGEGVDVPRIDDRSSEVILASRVARSSKMPISYIQHIITKGQEDGRQTEIVVFRQDPKTKKSISYTHKYNLGQIDGLRAAKLIKDEEVVITKESNILKIWL